jgi:hypothetical protein
VAAWLAGKWEHLLLKKIYIANADAALSPFWPARRVW